MVWLNVLIGLRKYLVLNVWCYVNVNVNVIEKCFVVEVIIDCKKLKFEIKYIED